MHDGTNRDGLPIGHLLILDYAYGQKDVDGDAPMKVAINSKNVHITSEQIHEQTSKIDLDQG